MDKPSPWRILASKIVYHNGWIKVREDKVVTPSGAEGVYGVIESDNSVCIVVLNDADEIFITNNYRYPAQAWKWELPGGGGDNQDALQAAQRELEEETGIIANNWTQLGATTVCNGLMTETMATFLARDITFTGNKELGDESIAEGKFISLEELNRMILNGEFNDGQSITALHLLHLFLSK